MSKQHLTAEVFAETIPHVQKSNFTRNSKIVTAAACALAIPGLLVGLALPAYGDAAPAVSTSSAQSPSASSLAVTNGNLAPATVDMAPRSRTLTPRGHGGKTARVAKIAKHYLGVPYRFGGESKSGFDCSGFVAYVYAKVGIHLPHSAVQQGRIGHRVSLRAAKPGDVVVMNGGAHVGIYIGHHRMIDAPRPGRRVSVDKIYDNYYFIVRF